MGMTIHIMYFMFLILVPVYVLFHLTLKQYVTEQV